MICFNKVHQLQSKGPHKDLLEELSKLRVVYDPSHTGLLVIVYSKANLFHRREREVKVTAVLSLFEDFLTDLVYVLILLSMTDCGLLQFSALQFIGKKVVAPLYYLDEGHQWRQV